VAKRAAATFRRFVAFVTQLDGKWLVRQRPAGVLNAHLWEFPNAEVDRSANDLATVAANLLRATPASLEALTTVKHSITRFRISLEAYVATGPIAYRQNDGDRWLALRELQRLPFTSAHRKVLTALRRTTPP
jgi:A/G-specific adenine glycosylase